MRTVAYVRNHLVSEYERLGWRRGEPGLSYTHHGDWAEIMEWAGEGEPKYPDKKPEPK